MGHLIQFEANSQENRREWDKTENSDLQEGGVIHDTLEEGVPGENSRKEGEGEDETGDSDQREIYERGSVDQANMAEGEVNNVQEAVAEHLKDELADEKFDEGSELKQEAGVISQATSEDVESPHDVEDDGNIHEESGEEREMDELGGIDGRKMAESANQEELKESLTQTSDIDLSSQEESEGAPSRGEKERERQLEEVEGKKVSQRDGRESVRERERGRREVGPVQRRRRKRRAVMMR